MPTQYNSLRRGNANQSGRGRPLTMDILACMMIERRRLQRASGSVCHFFSVLFFPRILRKKMLASRQEGFIAPCPYSRTWNVERRESVHSSHTQDIPLWMRLVTTPRRTGAWRGKAHAKVYTSIRVSTSPSIATFQVTVKQLITQRISVDAGNVWYRKYRKSNNAQSEVNYGRNFVFAPHRIHSL